MKLLYTTFTIILFLNFSFSQTTIPAGDVSGLWNLSGSPYNVTGDITIQDGETLTIEPGVVVNFQGYFVMNVQGRLLAIGTVNDTIRFTATNTAAGWRGIRFINTPVTNDTSKLFYCDIRYGKNNSGTGDNPLGGGMFIRHFSKVHISNCYFAFNEARWGGAIQCRDSAHILIEHSTFANNYAEFSGAGIRAIDFSDPVIRYNVLHNNTVGSGGAALYFYRSNALVLSNLIYNNTSSASGGAAALDNSMPIFINNLITSNNANSGGAISFTTLSHAKFINNTFANNSATNGGALYFSLSSNPDFINNIFWGNNAPFGTQVFINNDNSDPNFFYCVVQFGIIGFVGPGAAGNYNGTYLNNLEVNPLFIGSGSHPYSISETSPVIDFGTPDTTGLNLPLYDLAGNFRIDNGIVDIGAYEYPSEIPVELSSFTASVNANNVSLSWITASEINNLGFDIERRINGDETGGWNSWEKIGFVQGKGTTTEISHYSFSDNNLSYGSYQYRLKQNDFDGTFKYYDLAETIDIISSLTFYLGQNYPNPFNPSTVINFHLPEAGYVTLKVYDVLGSEVETLVNEQKDAGNHNIIFNASNLSTGIYYYNLVTGNYIQTNKMMLIK